MLARFVFLLLLARSARANVFYTNCTIPPPGSNVVFGSDIRSTLDILWSSFFTIGLCTWTAQHPSISPRPPKEWGKTFGKSVRRIWAFWRKLRWMVAAVFAPEFLAGRALGDYMAARRSSTTCTTMIKCFQKSRNEWTPTHVFYANMGGFTLNDGDTSDRSRSRDPTNEKRLIRPQISPCPCPGHEDWTERASRDHLAEEPRLRFELPIALNSAQLCMLINRGIIKYLPCPTEDEIEDRSKEDLVVKLFTLGQIIWLCIQLLVRKISGLPSTQLEIAVLAFAICMVGTYLLWLRKPKDIEGTMDVFTTRPLSNDDKNWLIRLNRWNLSGYYHKPEETIPIDTFNNESELLPGFPIERFGFVVAALVFGACHCIAWNFHFPTQIEQTLWRATSVLTAGIMPMHLFVTAGLTFMYRKVPRDSFFSRMIRYLSNFLTYVLYPVCRAFILVEMIRSLFYSPPQVFMSTWSSAIPHVG